MSANPYDTLGIGSDAAAFTAVNDAYGLLIDPSRRSVFDRETARRAAAASTVDVHVVREYDPLAHARSPIEPLGSSGEHRTSPFSPFDRLFGRFVGTGFLRTDPFHAHDTVDYDVYLSPDEAATGVTATIDIGFGRARVAIPPGITRGVRLSALVRQHRVTFHVHVAGG